MSACPRCGQATTFWQRNFGGGLCAECGKTAAAESEARQRAAEEEQRRAAREAERHEAELRARRLAHRRRCAVCGSEMLKSGYVPDSGGSPLTGGNRMRFKTDVFEGYQLLALACMACGHVSFWISIDELPRSG